MRRGIYEIFTTTLAGPEWVEQFEGSRTEARARCRAIDTKKDGGRIRGQTTSPRFVSYLEGDQARSATA